MLRRLIRNVAIVAATSLGCLAAQAQVRVTVGNVNTVSDVSIFLAEKHGYFKAEGLAIELVSFNSAAKMIAPLGAGQLDVGGGTVSAGLYNAFARKIGIRITADKGSARPGYVFSQILVRKDIVDSGRYRDFRDLKGMKVAIAAAGTGNAATLNMALKKAGLSYGDVSTVELGFPDHVIAFQNKAIDAAVTSEPNATIAIQRGLAVKVAGNEDLYRNHETSVLLFSDDFARNKPDIALKFMRAYIRGARDYNDALKDGHISGKGADDVIATLVEYTNIKDPKLHRDTEPSACDPDGIVDIESLESDLDFFKEQKLIADPNIHARDVVDPSFAQKIVAELGPYKKP